MEMQRAGNGKRASVRFDAPGAIGVSGFTIAAKLRSMEDGRGFVRFRSFEKQKQKQPQVLRLALAHFMRQGSLRMTTDICRSGRQLHYGGNLWLANLRPSEKVDL
jgi:hypothetical protein